MLALLDYYLLVVCLLVRWTCLVCKISLWDLDRAVAFLMVVMPVLISQLDSLASEPSYGVPCPSALAFF
jgi:hypothetical protein